MPGFSPVTFAQANPGARATPRALLIIRSMYFPFAGFIPALPTAPTRVQPGKSFELMAHYCSFCEEQVLHTVLEKLGAPEPVAAGLASVLLQCNACQAFALR